MSNNTSSYRDRSFGHGFPREPFGDIKNTLNRLTRPLRNVFSRHKDKTSESPKRVQRPNDDQKAQSPTSPFRRFGSLRFNKKSPIKLDRIRRSFRDSFRRRKSQVPEASRSIQWPTDEQAVRSSTCSFAIKYLGCIEVYERQGLDICEEAMNILKKSRRRRIRGFLHVNGDGLRVVDKDTKALILDQSIEKVSFCAAYRHEKHDFSYICRDGTTKRWMCHGFLATKDPGERLSQAVGYAFTVCLERKHRYNTECRVRMTYDKQNSAFTRIGSFRQRTLTDRLHNERGVDVGKAAPAAIVTPQPKAQPPKYEISHAIERPHASPLMLERQGSCRALSSLNSQSPFKRRMSLRLNDLPSNVDRQRLFSEQLTNEASIQLVSASPEDIIFQPSTIQSMQLQPMNQQSKIDVIGHLCDELNLVSQKITPNDTQFVDGPNDDSTELNFDLQSVSMSTADAAPDLMSSITPLPNTVATDFGPFEALSSNDAVNPFVLPTTTTTTTTSDYTVSVNESRESQMLYATPTCHVISIDEGLPAILQHSAAANGKNDECDFSKPRAVATAIVPPNNTQLSQTHDILSEFLENTTLESNQTDFLQNLDDEPLSNDPFDAEWVANVASIIEEFNNLPITTEVPIITTTNPFLMPGERMVSEL